MVHSVSRIFSAGVRNSRSRSSKVINFGTNRKRLCDFLLVDHSNLGPISAMRHLIDFVFGSRWGFRGRPSI